jgi:hypothetical protein
LLAESPVNVPDIFAILSVDEDGVYVTVFPDVELTEIAASKYAPLPCPTYLLKLVNVPVRLVGYVILHVAPVNDIFHDVAPEPNVKAFPDESRPNTFCVTPEVTALVGRTPLTGIIFITYTLGPLLPPAEGVIHCVL